MATTVKLRLSLTDIDLVYSAVKDGVTAPIDDRVNLVLRLEEMRRWAVESGYVTVVGRVDP